ncbi:hypothetical protein A3860_21615 [Niastella vici]|uniref:Uncharacterized protein n=2 Tax=Niastella vici TaxID=1703345 RepID=A0A1V9G0B5_9BACT|nr:hypothetical protein A3860_21615 [Niastella vici]
MSFDISSESKVYAIMDPIREKLQRFFAEKSYGNGLVEIFIVFTCRPGNFKVRKRFDKAIRVLSYDVITSFEDVVALPVTEMKRMLIEALNGSVEVILGYHKKINDFDFDSFEKHWDIFFEELN